MSLSASQIPFKTTADLLVSKRYFSRTGEGRYVLGFPDLGITIEASQLHRGRERDLLGELTVRTTLAGAKQVEGVLSSASFNFSSQESRRRQAAFLTERSGAALDWVGALEICCLSVREAETAGDPIQPLASYPLPGPEAVWEVSGIPILRQHPMILFGGAGSAKSYLALWIAVTLALRGIRVLYADWEFSAEDHRERLGRLCGTSLPIDTLHYVRCGAPLIHEAQRLQGHIVAQNVAYVICDSIGFAVPGRPEDAEHATAYFRAVRSLGVGSLHLAHLSKGQEQGDETVFGSVFWGNAARSIWFVKRADESDEQSNHVEIALYHKKSNVGRKLSARGLRFTFGEATTTVDRFEVKQHAELSVRLPLWQRIEGAVSRSPQSLTALASELDAKEDTIRRTVQRMTGKFTQRPGGLVGLASSRWDDR